MRLIRNERRFVAALAVIVSALCACSQRESTTLSEQPLPHVRAVDVQLVKPRPESEHLVPLVPLRRARLAPRSGGQVVALLVDDQQRVKEGDELVRFASDDPRGGLISAQAAIQRVQESIRDNKSELATARGLAAKGVESARNVERLENEEARLRAQLREAKGQLVRAKDRVGATAITAPFDGTITEVSTELGEYMSPGAVVLVLAQLDPMAVEVPLTQDEAALSDAGGLTFSVISRSNRFDPELEWVATEADPATGTFTARLRIPNSDRKLRAGELVDVEISGAEQAKVKAVPTTAVRWAADASYVLRVDGEEVTRVDVEVLDDADGRVAIEGPLQPGDRVVQSGPNSLLSGDTVKVVDAPPETLASQ